MTSYSANDYSANVQLVNRDIVTAIIYCYITTEFHYAKRDSRCLSLLGFSPCKFWQALVYLSKYLTVLLTHFDGPKNLLELPHPTRNIRKCSNKLMTNTFGEINLQSKQDIICHVAKVKPETSAHYGADVIPLLAYVICPSNPMLWKMPEKCISHTVKTKQSENSLETCLWMIDKETIITLLITLLINSFLPRWLYCREHLKYVWNVYCVVTNHRWDLRTTETTSNERVPIDHGRNYFRFV